MYKLRNIDGKGKWDKYISGITNYDLDTGNADICSFVVHYSIIHIR